MYDFGVVVAKDIEEDAITDRLERRRTVNYPHAIQCTEGFREGYSIVVVRISRQGSVSSAIASADLMRDFNPKFLVSMGIAAGFRQNVDLRSVVIADQVIGYEYSKTIGGSIENEPEPYKPPKIRNYASDIDRKTVTGKSGKLEQEFRIVIGPIASGSKVVASRGFLNKLLILNRHMAGLEIEAEGIGAVAEHRGRNFFVFKGISDYGDRRSKGARTTERAKKLHDARQEQAAQAAAEAFIQFLRGVRGVGSILPASEQTVRDTTTLEELPAASANEAQFLQIVAEGGPLQYGEYGELDLQCRLLPGGLWNQDRREHAYQDNGEKPVRLETEYLKGATFPEGADATISRLITEIRARIAEHERGRLKLKPQELEDLQFTERQLSKEGSNPYPRLVAVPETFDIGHERILRITLGPSKYGIALIRERNINVPTAQALRLSHVLNSLAVRVAVVRGENEEERVVEFHQRSELNGTYKFAWDVGAAGYIDSGSHKDPNDPIQERISPWQTCVEEIETELRIPGYLLPHRDKYVFFGVGMNEPTGQLDLLALCSMPRNHLPVRTPKDRVKAYKSCHLDPETVSTFILEKRRGFRAHFWC